MNWDVAHVDSYGLFPPPGGFVLSVAFLCAAVWIARRRPALLAPLWAASSLGAVVFVVGWHAAGWEIRDAMSLAPHAALVAGLPIGSTVLALRRMRRSAPGSGPLPMALAATAAFGIGVLASVIVLYAIDGRMLR